MQRERPEESSETSHTHLKLPSSEAHLLAVIQITGSHAQQRPPVAETDAPPPLLQAQQKQKQLPQILTCEV